MTNILLKVTNLIKICHKIKINLKFIHKRSLINNNSYNKMIKSIIILSFNQELLIDYNKVKGVTQIMENMLKMTLILKVKFLIKFFNIFIKK
jgi:hypothetical protein